MKRLKKIMLLVMMGSLLTITGCSSDDNGGSGGNAGDGTIVAKIDGSSFKSAKISSAGSLVTSTNTLILQGTNSDGIGFVFTINGYTGTGTYDIGGSSLSVALYIETDISNPANTQTWQAPYDTTVVGSISVSEDTGSNVKGTFEFTGENASDQSLKVITEGSFNLTVQSL